MCLLAWENEAFLAVEELGPDKVEIVVPSVSILAEPPVAVVTKVAEKHGTLELAKAYLEHLYSPAGQTLAAKHFFRPVVSDGIPADVLSRYAQVELFTIDDVFGGWSVVQPQHFDDGGIFDQIYQPGKLTWSSCVNTVYCRLRINAWLYAYVYGIVHPNSPIGLVSEISCTAAG